MGAVCCVAAGAGAGAGGELTLVGEDTMSTGLVGGFPNICCMSIKCGL